MLTLKKTAVAVLAFGSSAVFAGTMGPVCTPGIVTVPCARTAWDFGAQALYLDAGTNVGDYVGSVANNSTGAQNYVKPGNAWSWGFQIEGSYHFNTGNDVDLNWYHIDRSKSGLNNLGAGQVFQDNLDNSLWTGGSSVSASRKWDAVNLEFGQHVDFGEFVNTRFHGGLAYAHLKGSSTVSGNDTLHAGTQVRSFNTTYNGVGPRLGADNFYDWNNGFAVYAKGAMALFAGQSKFNTGYSQGYSTIGTTPVVTSFSIAGSTTQVVPELEAKLGGTYTYAMAQGDLSVDLGWMWINYFNPLQFGGVTGVASSDFNLQGPYLGLKWVGNVA